MRHCKKRSKLGRKSKHRRAMLRNLASSLVLHARIKTTEAKAKALRPYIERLITKAVTGFLSSKKSDKLHYFRMILRDIRNKKAAVLLFRIWADHFLFRPGGYTRIIKLGKRRSDSAQMAIIEMVCDNWLWDQTTSSPLEISGKLKKRWPELDKGIKDYERDTDERWIKQRATGPLPRVSFHLKKTSTSTAMLDISVGKLAEMPSNEENCARYPSSFLIRFGEGGHRVEVEGRLPAEVKFVEKECVRVICSRQDEPHFRLAVSYDGFIDRNPPIVRLLRENGATVRRGVVSFHQ